MKKLSNGKYEGERALFFLEDAEISDSVFCNGESPLKESKNISLFGCSFEWKYPLWYSKNIRVCDTHFKDTARSGIWYTDNIEIKDSLLDAPKLFRRSKSIRLFDVTFSDAQETLWYCSGIELKNVKVTGDYFCMNSSNITADNVTLDGNYVFDGCENVTVSNSRLMSKDSFWNCKNVTVKDSIIVGEYIGWNSENVTFINCTMESNQGFCYMKNVTLRGCKLSNTDLCFEYCTVDAEVDSHIDSVKNPISGRISAESIGEIILEPDRVDITKTEITEVANEQHIQL